MSIGKSLKEARKKQKMTQEQLADLAGISTMSIRRYESDARTPTIEVMKNIATALGTTTAALIGGNTSRVIINDLFHESKSDEMKLVELLNLKIENLGASIEADWSEGYLWLETPLGRADLTINQLKDLNAEIEDFTVFKLRQLIEKNTK